MGRKANPEGIKYPTDKARYDKNYLRAYGKKCRKCKGSGTRCSGGGLSARKVICSKCDGIGWVKI